MKKSDLVNKQIPPDKAMIFRGAYSKYDSKTVFCFFEGIKSDSAFYRNFIDRYFIDFNFYPIICNGVDFVINTFDEICGEI